MRYIELLTERVLNLSDEKSKAAYADQVWDILQKSYAKIGGFTVHASPEELAQKTGIWKLVRRGQDITAVTIYKDKLGRKISAVGTNGTDQGKQDYKMLQAGESSQKRSWVEASGAVERLMAKDPNSVGIPNRYASALLNKEIMSYDPDGVHYTRMIGGTPRVKIMFGFVNLDEKTAQKMQDQGLSLHDLPPNITLKK